MFMKAKFVRRAIAAYYRAGGTCTPNRWSRVEEHDGRRYVVLANRQRILAVYRVTKDERLRSLKLWPKAILEDEPPELVELLEETRRRFYAARGAQLLAALKQSSRHANATEERLQ